MGQICKVIFFKRKNLFYPSHAERGREQLDVMSLRFADISLLEMLGRPSLRYAVIEPLPYSTAFLNLGFQL